MEPTPAGLLAIRAEMARQHGDALASLDAAQAVAGQIAADLRKTGRLLLLGMGGSHAVGRIAEPLYRALGIDAVALPLSEQLGQPLPLAGRTVIVTSQSGESAEVLRWFAEAGRPTGIFGLTLEGGSSLARTVPCLVGAGGTENAFAATRSLTVCAALHAAVLAALGVDAGPVRAVLSAPVQPDVAVALRAVAAVRSLVTTGRHLCGVAEAIALGLTELSRRPCFALEGGQLRHGPMEMLGPEVGVVLFRGQEPTAGLVAGLAGAVAAAGSPAVLFDASGAAAPPGVVQIALPSASGLAAALALLPAAQTFMIGFAAERVADVGTPVRSSKITRVE
jgi:fructoselysine-6-P-deglycase FrlB-like protein